MKLEDFLKVKKVRCVNDGGNSHLTEGKEYEIKSIDYISVSDNDGDKACVDTDWFEPVFDDLVDNTDNCQASLVDSDNCQERYKMIQSYVEIYRQSDTQGRLDIIKRFLDKMFPHFDFSVIDGYTAVCTRDKYQFYSEKVFIGSLLCSDPDFVDVEIEVTDSIMGIEVRCYDKTLNNVIYDLLEIEDVHR